MIKEEDIKSGIRALNSMADALSRSNGFVQAPRMASSLADIAASLKKIEKQLEAQTSMLIKLNANVVTFNNNFFSGNSKKNNT